MKWFVWKDLGQTRAFTDIAKKEAYNKQYPSIKYYTIIDFNEVDIRIYLSVKVIIHRGR